MGAQDAWQTVQRAEGWESPDVGAAARRIIVHEPNTAISKFRAGDKRAHDGATLFTRADDEHVRNANAAPAEFGVDQPFDPTANGHQRNHSQPGFDDHEARVHRWSPDKDQR